MSITPAALHTQRLLLRPITPALLTQLFRTQSKPRIMALLDVDEAGYQKHEGMVNGGMETDRLSLLFFLLVRKDSRQTIGQCGFHSWNRFHDRAELFYFLNAPENRRKGYMKEALKPILRYGFEEMKLHRAEAYVAPENIASSSLLQHFQFQKEGTARGHYLVEGVYEDSDLYSLLAPEAQL